MLYRRLGRTGLKVSVLSLGTGGPNRFGQARYVSRKDIISLARRALDLGINYFDTAGSYEDAESRLGEALRGVPRDQYYLSSKVLPLNGNSMISAAETRQLVERTLRRMRVEALDILFLHRLSPQSYDEALVRLAPALQSLRAEGKIRFIGISESTTLDQRHGVLKRALQDDFFDTIMVAYHMANRSAEEEVLPLAQAKDVGVIGMVAARHLVTRNASERLRLFSKALLGLATSPRGLDELNARLRSALSILRRPVSKRAACIAREVSAGVLTLPAAGNFLQFGL